MIETWDFYVRLIGIGSSLMLLAQLIEGEIRTPIKIAVIGLIVGVIAYIINSSAALRPTGPIDHWLDLVALSPPFWAWLFGRRLFEREPPPEAIHAAVIALVISWFVANWMQVYQPAMFYIIHFISLALIIDLVRVAFRERADDLVEKRRVIRLWLPLLVAAQAGLVLIYEIIYGTSIAIPAAQLLNAVLIVLLTLFSGLALLRTDPELLIESNESAARDAQPAPDLSPAEAVLHERLTGAMAAGGYREPGLTIAALAERLDVPEHRLRALINRRLGYRNFSAFLNRHRIAEAREKLVDKDSVDLPVLTIAMDLGYNSLATFNRAFKSETGTTPSDFRRLSLGSPPVESADQN